MKSAKLGAISVALALGVFATAARAVPLNLDFGPFGPKFHDVGPIDAGVNVIRAGNVTASGSTVGSSITFSVPVGLQVDQMTVEFLSYFSTGGASLRVGLDTPNEGKAVLGVGIPSLNTEIDFVDLTIVDPGGVTTSFVVTPHPSVFGGVNHDYRLRIYASAITSTVPEPGSAALLAAGFAGLLGAWRRTLRA